MDYPFLQPETIKTVMGDKVLVEWEEAKEDLLNGRLVRPETQRARHYTGVILKRGVCVGEEDLKEGARVFFEQFSNFEKFQSEDGKKRFALVSEGACLAIVPPRVNLKCEDWQVYGEGDE